MFGGIERHTKKAFLVEVPQRDAATLIPIIQYYIQQVCNSISVIYMLTCSLFIGWDLPSTVMNGGHTPPYLVWDTLTGQSTTVSVLLILSLEHTLRPLKECGEDAKP